jgi:hypothetical protein
MAHRVQLKGVRRNRGKHRKKRKQEVSAQPIIKQSN